jgi:hypothetical protein
MFYDARKRARRQGLAFDIEPDDIVIPERCPVFGTPFYTGRVNDHPSLDRVVPCWGYTRDNIWVISFRANRIKSDATLPELQTLVARLESRLA